MSGILKNYRLTLGSMLGLYRDYCTPKRVKVTYSTSRAFVPLERNRFPAPEKLTQNSAVTLRVQAPNNHILSQILTYITTILSSSTWLLGPLDPGGKGRRNGQMDVIM